MNLIICLMIIALLVQMTGFFIYISRLQMQHAAERADMLDRLMSRNLDEYKTHVQPVDPGSPVDLTDEEEWVREIEAMKTG